MDVEGERRLIAEQLTGKGPEELVNLGNRFGLGMGWDILLVIQEKELPDSVKEQFLNRLLSQTEYHWRMARPELAKNLDVDLYADGEPSSLEYRKDQIRWLVGECRDFTGEVEK